MRADGRRTRRHVGGSVIPPLRRREVGFSDRFMIRRCVIRVARVRRRAFIDSLERCCPGRRRPDLTLVSSAVEWPRPHGSRQQSTVRPPTASSATTRSKHE